MASEVRRAVLREEAELRCAITTASGARQRYSLVRDEDGLRDDDRFQGAIPTGSGARYRWALVRDNDGLCCATTGSGAGRRRAPAYDDDRFRWAGNGLWCGIKTGSVAQYRALDRNKDGLCAIDTAVVLWCAVTMGSGAR